MTQPEWRLVGPKDLALLVVAGLILSVVVALPLAIVGRLIFDASTDCEAKFRLDLFKLFGMLVFAPVAESIILGGVVVLLAKFQKWTAVVSAAAIAAVLHTLIDGPLSFVVLLPFIVFARIFQIGQLNSEFSVGVKRAAICHAAYNTPIFLAASLCTT